MPEHDDRYVRSDLPSTTGEFRAAPDASASTAEFKAFVANQDRDAQRGGQEGVWPEQPWAGEAKQSSSNRTIVLIGAVVVVVAIIIAIIVAVG